MISLMEELFYIPPTMIWPLAACLVLTGIHVYLGVHVIARKVIFVDLALAQIAALGTVSGVLLGYEVGKDTTSLYFYSLAFTIFGAFIFSVTRMRGERVPHEAFIGIVYAVTFATTILVLARSPLGPQELDHIIKGELLWVQRDTVLKTALIYALVGIFHFLFRKKFMAISLDPVAAENSGINVRLWDFLFYMSFGFVITSSVAIAGVFLVFSYLVIPSVGAMLLTDRLRIRLAIGWIGGSIISFIGVKLSWDTGLPTSPLIVCVLATALVVSGMIHFLRTAPRKLVALRNMAGALAVVLIFVAAIFFFRKHDEDPFEHAMHLLESKLSTDRITALASITSYPQYQSQWLPLVTARLSDEDASVRRAALDVIAKLGTNETVGSLLPLLSDESDDVRGAAIETITRLGNPDIAPELTKRALLEQDPEFKLALLEGALELGNRDAILPMLSLMESDNLFAEDAFHNLQSHLELPFQRNETEKVRRWLAAAGNRLTWDSNSKVFKYSP